MVRKLLGILLHQIAQSGFLFSVGFICLIFITQFSYGQTVQTFTTPGTGTVNIPANSRVVVEVWGAGGSGSTAVIRRIHGNGGGGGAYAADTFIVLSPTTYSYTVGQGGVDNGVDFNGENSLVSIFGGATLVEAQGGFGATILGGFGAGGAVITGVIGDSGGSGAAYVDSDTSGGGGSSAGVDTSVLPFVAIAGQAAVNEVGGNVPAGYEGGDGAEGLTSGNNPGNNGISPGGGGSGGHKSSNNATIYNGGNGGDGQVRITICEFYGLTSTTAIDPTNALETFDVTLTGSLPDGTYTVTYNLGFPNDVTGATASMTVSGGTNSGTFTIPDLASAGATTITITNISNGSCGENISANNTATFTNDPDMNIFGDGNPIVHAPDFLSSLFDFDKLTDFGFVGVGETVSQTYTLSNVKSGTLDISDLNINFQLGDLSQFGLDKTNVDANNPLAGFNSATFDITFTPTSVGVNAIQVSIGSNDPTYNPFTFWIQGNGVKAATPYCTPRNLQGNDSSKRHYISNVDIRTINNTTTGITSKYSNFTDPSDPDIPGFSAINVERGETVNGNVTITVNGDNTGSGEVVVWLDFDQDDSLEDTTTEKFTFPVSFGADSGTETKDILVPVSFDVPPGANFGTTRMRIAFHDNSDTTYDACDFKKNKGEVEDYEINVTRCILNSWTGAVSSDWNDAGNWSCGEVPSDIDNGYVFITDVSPNPSPVISTGAGNEGYAYDLEIDPTGSLVVQDNYIDIEGVLTIDGVLNLSGTAQLLQQDGSTFNDDSVGYITIEQQGTADLYTFNYWSSPVYVDNTVVSGYGASRVNNYTAAGVLPGITFVPGYDGSAPSNIAEYWIYKFNDKTAGDYSEWVQVLSTGTIVAGEGFTMKGPGTGGVAVEYPYTFQGKPNAGIISLDLAAGNGYLIGNPYPSALDADQFIVDNINPSPIFDGTLYFWEHWGGGSHNSSDYQGGYATYNLSGGIGTGTGVAASGGGTKVPERYIPVGQGFFVTADAGGSITFNNGQRAYVTEGASSVFFKSQTQKKTAQTDVRRKLRLGIEMDKGFKKEILLTEDSRATENFDYGFDGKLIDGYSHDIYWSMEDQKYSIQGVPEFSKNSVFELGVLMEYSGEIKIGVNVFENDNKLKKVYLLDRETQNITEITENPVSFNLEKGDHKGRFAITFLPKEKPVSSQKQLDDGIEAVMNNVYRELQITRMVDARVHEVALYNLLGQKVYSTSSDLSDRYIRIPVEQRQGIYVLRIQTDKGAVGKQIIIEE